MTVQVAYHTPPHSFADDTLTRGAMSNSSALLLGSALDISRYAVRNSIVIWLETVHMRVGA